MSNFDDCYAVRPDLKSRPADFEKFWKERIDALRKVPIEADARKKVSSRLLTEANIAITYQGIGKYQLRGQLIGGKTLLRKPPVIVLFGDYEAHDAVYKSLISAGFYQFLFRMRGHEAIIEKPEKRSSDSTNDKKEEEPSSPGFFAENLTDLKNYYLTSLYLDAIRTVEMLRLRKEVNTSHLFFWGRGIGAALALFAARYAGRESTLLLEGPAFSALGVTQNKSEASYAREILDGLKRHRRDRELIKKNLSYLDAVYLASGLTAQTAVTANLKRRTNVPEGAFAMFHALSGEKEMHLFLEDDTAGRASEAKRTPVMAAEYFSERARALGLL